MKTAASAWKMTIGISSKIWLLFLLTEAGAETRRFFLVEPWR